MSILEYFNNTVKDEVSKEEKEHEKESHEQQKIKLSLDLAFNIESIKKIMGFASDIVVREFTIIPETQVRAAVILIKGLAERELINEQVIGPLMHGNRAFSVKDNTELFQRIKEYGIPNIYVNEEVDVNNIVSELISGNTILLLDKIDKTLIIGSSGWKDRAISEPTSENSVRGPKDSFTENIENNPLSPFPQIEHSERPDKVSAALLEGRVAILVDTTPYALIVPTIFFSVYSINR